MLKQKLWKVKLHVCIKGAVHIRSSPHHRLSCGQILEMTDCHVENFSTWEMWRKFVMWRNNVYNLWRFVAFYAVLLQNRDLRSFVVISVLSRFTRFCVEKNSAKNCACGGKITNIRYAPVIVKVKVWIMITLCFYPSTGCIRASEILSESLWCQLSVRYVNTEQPLNTCDTEIQYLCLRSHWLAMQSYDGCTLHIAQVWQLRQKCIPPLEFKFSSWASTLVELNAPIVGKTGSIIVIGIGKKTLKTLKNIIA